MSVWCWDLLVVILLNLAAVSDLYFNEPLSLHGEIKTGFEITVGLIYSTVNQNEQLGNAAA